MSVAVEERSGAGYQMKPHDCQEYIPALDGIRGMAVLAVFFFHYGGGATSHNPILHAIGVVKQTGWMGVDLFFVLSGFLITGILFDARGGVGYLKNFYARRALRLFPLIYGLAIVLLLCTEVIGAHWRLGHLGYLFYAANIVSYLDPSLNGPSPFVAFSHLWSLAVEEQFYLLWPLVVILVPDRVALVRICTALIVAALFFRIALDVSHLVTPYFLYMETFCRMDSLALGGLLAMLYRGPRAIPKPVSAGFIGFGLLGLIAIGFHEKSLSYLAPWMHRAGFTFVAFLAGGIVLSAIEPGSLCNRIASLAILRRCGKYSYGIYVYHVLLLPICLLAFTALQRRVHSQAFAGLTYISASFALVFGLSALSFEFFEKPIMKLKTKFAYRIAT